MRRREFIAALGGAAIWPLATRAQQSAMSKGAAKLIAKIDSAREVANLP